MDAKYFLEKRCTLICTLNTKFYRRLTVKNCSNKYLKLVTRYDKQMIYILKAGHYTNYANDLT